LFCRLLRNLLLNSNLCQYPTNPPIHDNQKSVRGVRNELGLTLVLLHFFFFTECLSLSQPFCCLVSSLV
jgi:hypothetical protein